MDAARDAPTIRWPSLARLSDAAWRVIAAGTEGYDTETRRGLVVANITGYLASISSLSYALN